MADIDDCKNFIAMQKNYPDWNTMENFIIDHNNSCDTALLLVSAMELVCYEYSDQISREENLRYLTFFNYSDSINPE